MNRAKKFLEFCAASLGTDVTAPLKDANGAAINGLVEAYRAVYPPREQKPLPSVQSFDESCFTEPWTVYVIRCSITGTSYVGTAVDGFSKRYPRGEWWTGHHNERLGRDALVYGISSFRVLIYACTDEKDMRRTEATIIAANRMQTYNVRQEPCNV